jgi:microcystin-dependent protein
MKDLKKSALAAVGMLGLTLGAAATPNQAEAGVDPYLGDIMIVSFNFCPSGWSQAAGQILPIAQNQALFSLLGTQFGGNGTTTFALPDLRGRITLGQGSGNGLTPRQSGQSFGSEVKMMTEATLPQHNHTVNANNQDGDLPGPGGKLLAAAPTGGTGNETIYSQANPNVTMSPAMISPAGSNAVISTQDPTLGLIHCIAVQGSFPPRN